MLNFFFQEALRVREKKGQQHCSGWNKFIWSVCKQGDKSIYGISWFYAYEIRCIKETVSQIEEKNSGEEKEMNINQQIGLETAFFMSTHIPQGLNSGAEAKRKKKVPMKWLLSGQWVKSILQQQQTSLYYGTGYTGSAVKFQQDNHKHFCSNQSHLPLSVISTFWRVCCTFFFFFF